MSLLNPAAVRERAHEMLAIGLADGLADTGKVTVDWDTGQDDPKTGKPRTIRKDVHKVQILDPATGRSWRAHSGPLGGESDPEAAAALSFAGTDNTIFIARKSPKAIE